MEVVVVVRLWRSPRAKGMGAKALKTPGTSQYQNLCIFFVSVSYYSLPWLIFSNARSAPEIGMG